MNSTKYFSYLLVIWMIGLSSCTDLVDTFKDFQGDGEIPYAGKIDSLIVREGLHKLQYVLCGYSRRTGNRMGRPTKNSEPGRIFQDRQAESATG